MGPKMGQNMVSLDPKMTPRGHIWTHIWTHFGTPFWVILEAKRAEIPLYSRRSLAKGGPRMGPKMGQNMVSLEAKYGPQGLPQGSQMSIQTQNSLETLGF